jgi:hypothetical protein
MSGMVKHKRLLKVELFLVKIMPMIVSLAYLIIATSYCFGVDMSIMSSIAGMSFIPLLFMYVSSYVFGFCSYHRMFLHYIAFNDVISLVDSYIGIQYRMFLASTVSIIGIALFIILYLYVKSHKRAIT